MAMGEQQTKTLFSEAILSRLDERQRELAAGNGFEVGNTTELLAKIQKNAIRAQAA